MITVAADGTVDDEREAFHYGDQHGNFVAAMAAAFGRPSDDNKDDAGADLAADVQPDVV